MRSGDFDLTALHAALDAQRQGRGLSWAQVMREISALAGLPVRRVSASTVSGLGSRSVAEADGVLQMLRWLDRPPESFIPGFPEGSLERARLPRAGRGQILRIDSRKLHAALDARRAARGLTWRDAADEIGGVSPASLASLSKGGRTSFPLVTRMTIWLGEPVASFTRLSVR